MIGLSCLVIGIFSALFYFQFESALKERVLLQLSSVKKLKVAQIENELNNRIEAIKSLIIQSDAPLLDQLNQPLFDKLFFSQSQDTFAIAHYTLAIPDTLAPGEVIIRDLTPQHKSAKITLAFITRDSMQYLIGIATLPKIQSVLLERAGLGQTGESYLVGEDFKMRTLSRFFPKRNPLDIQVKSQGVLRAIANQPGEEIISDYRDVPVFSSFEKISFNGLIWVILSEIDYQEALFPLQSLRKNFYAMLLIMLFFVLIISYQLARLLVKPVLNMELGLHSMAKGLLLDPLHDHSRKDEIGAMFRALDKLNETMRKTIEFAGKIGEGDFQAQYHLLSEDDKLGEALLQMKNKLKEYQKREANHVRENQQSMIDGEEKERARLSKEIHDGLGPMLTSLKLKIQALTLENTHKKHLLKILDETIKETRQMANNLMPSVLQDFGAAEAIENLAEQLRLSTSLRIRYSKDTQESPRISKEINITLYRIAQEVLNNAIKHANASEIRLSLTEFEEHVSLFIADNGSGFDQRDVFSGNGLRNMRERVKLVDGTMTIHSDHEGTRIEVEIPL